MTQILDHSIEDHLLNGTKSIHTLLNSIKNNISNEEHTKLMSLFKDISPRMLEEIHTSGFYKTQIREWNRKKINGKISNTHEYVQGLIDHIIDTQNKKILIGKRKDTKHNRQKEKSTIINWLKKNKNDLKKLFDLYNMIMELEKIK